MIHTSNGQKFYVNDKLNAQLQKFTVDQLKKKDNNKLFLVCGDTGIGKSAFTFQMSSVIDPDFGLKNIQFTTAQMQEGLKTLPNQAVVFDEAFRGASGRNTMNKTQKQLLQMLYEIRQLNQCVFLVSPSFFRLDEAIAVELADAMFYIYKIRNSKRRAFRVFNNKKKNMLYYRAKKYKKSYALVKSLFNGTFPKTYVVDDMEYRKRKFESLVAMENPLSEHKQKVVRELKEREAKLWTYVVKTAGSYGKAAKAIKAHGIDLTKARIHDKIREHPPNL